MLSMACCQHCRHDFDLSQERCPHCALPGLFPNVAMAEEDGERHALGLRYDQALDSASARGAEAVVLDFEAAAARSMAVIARSYGDTYILASGDNRGFGTYYRQIEAETQFPKGEDWDILRRAADLALFRGYEKNVRFAALSLEQRGLGSYGDFSWVLKEDMIAHRASVFEENSVFFMRNHDIRISEVHRLPRGFRATWAERGKLCTAKLAGRISKATAASDYPGLLLRSGASTLDDEFVEVHVGGPVTVRTLERIVVTRGDVLRWQGIEMALRENLERFGVELET